MVNYVQVVVDRERIKTAHERERTVKGEKKIDMVWR
jgi:hypothetical protein